MIENFSLAAITLKGPDKARNGDFYASEILEGEHLLVLALADGVGSSPCDWKASRLGCENFIRFFKEGKGSIPERIKKAVIDANDNLLFESISSCQGMKTTLSVLVWDHEKEAIHYLNIGDSRIYLFKGGTLLQLSEDDSTAIILRGKDGEPVSLAGGVVVRDAITNALGIAGMTINVHTRKVENGTGFVLASDGFYNCTPSFSSDIRRLLGMARLQNELELLANKYTYSQTDDLTGVVVRIDQPIEDEELVFKLILQGNDPEELHLSPYQLSGIIRKGLVKSIQEKAVRETLALLQYCDVNTVELSREDIGALISWMAKVDFQDRAVYQRLLSKMRRSR